MAGGMADKTGGDGRIISYFEQWDLPAGEALWQLLRPVQKGAMPLPLGLSTISCPAVRSALDWCVLRWASPGAAAAVTAEKNALSDEEEALPLERLELMAVLVALMALARDPRTI